MLSATALPGCARKFFLSRTRDYFECPKDLWDAGRGSLIHGVLEGQRIQGVTVEQRFYKAITRGPFAPYVLSGQCDYYDPVLRELEDFKSMEGDGLYIILRYGIKDDHILQLSVYRWLMNNGHVKPAGFTGPVTPEAVLSWPTVNLPVDSAKLNYVTMRRVFSTGTTFTFTEKTDFKSPNGPNGGKKYPGEISRVRQPYSKGKPKWDITAAIPPLQLLSYEEVADYVAMRGPNLVRGFVDDAFMPPGVMHDKDESWQCDWCGVEEICQGIEQQQTAAQQSLFSEGV
jgi:hypothetical protein